MKKKLLMLLLAVGVMFLCSCMKSTGVLETTTQLSIERMSQKTLVVNVSSTVVDASEEIVQLEGMTVEQLRKKRLFASILAGSKLSSKNGEINLNLTISSLKKVTSFQRKMYGPAAGRAFIIVEGQVQEVKSKKTVGEFRVQGESSSGSALAGTTGQAIERAVEQIILFLQGS